MKIERTEFAGTDGHKLAARLDAPDGPIRAYALFAHCFTCGKDIFAASRIAQALTEHGIAVLRFDFTGLGASEGEFANTNFSSNLADLVGAADHLRQHYRAPGLLIGHSLGGAAVLAAAADIPEVQAVVTIGAPSDPSHVAGLFRQQLAQIEAEGEAQVQLAGRPFRIKRQFLVDAAEQKLDEQDRAAAPRAAGDACAARRHGRHRQRDAHLHRGQASEELHLARRCRPPADAQERCRVCGESDRGLE